MVKRAARNKIKNVFLFLAYALFLGAFLVGIFFIIRAVWPFLGNTNSSNITNIIKPVAKATLVSDLKKKLSEKGIVFDSIKSASDSSAIVGKIKDGPLVYFSQDQDTAWQISALELILTRLNLNNKKPNLIDLRQARPIVKF